MIIEQEIHYCDHGCGQVARYFSKFNNTWRCCEYASQCPSNRKKRGKIISKVLKKLYKLNIIKAPFYGKHRSNKTKEKIGLANRKPHIFKDGIEYKECGHCKEIKLLSEFGKSNRNWDKLRITCKECRKKYDKQSIEYRIKNKKKLQKNSRDYYHFHKKQRKNYENNRYKNNIQYKFRRNISNRILAAIKNNNKSSDTLKLIGYSLDDCKKYIESLFIDGMTWQDFLDGRIHIHHLQPCHTFDLTDTDQQKECFNLTNLYPVWKEEHQQNYEILHKG